MLLNWRRDFIIKQSFRASTPSPFILLKKYIANADDDDLLVACAYVRRHKGFPHEQHFHLAVEKVDADDLEQAKRFLSEDEDKALLLELGLIDSMDSQLSNPNPAG